MSAREIVHVRAKDFQTAVYVAVRLQEGTRYLVETGNLCPDSRRCTGGVVELGLTPDLSSE